MKIDFLGDLTLENALIEESAQAGIYVIESPLTMRRCVLRKNVMSVGYEGSFPNLEDTNVYELNEQNEPVTGLELIPAPMPSMPL